MTILTRRMALALVAALGLTAAPALSQAQVKEIRIDWATYNPVSIVLKEQGLLRRSSPRTASPCAGCSPPAPTRRWNS